MRKSLVALGLLASSAALAVPAEAATHIWQAAAVNSSGDDYTVSFTYDDAVSPFSFDWTNSVGEDYTYKYFTNITSFSVVGADYDVTVNSGISQSFTLFQGMPNFDKGGIAITGGEFESGLPGYTLGMYYIGTSLWATADMPATLNIADPYYDAGFTMQYRPTEEDEPYEVLNLRFTSGGFLAPAAAVPEPATWAMMIGGFAFAGAAMRRRRASVAFAA